MIGAVMAVLRHPTLWPTALVELRRFVPDGWWRRRPFLPLPDRAMLRFRLVTHYGDPDHAPDADDIVRWLRWCRDENRRVRV